MHPPSSIACAVAPVAGTASAEFERIAQAHAQASRIEQRFARLAGSVRFAAVAATALLFVLLLAIALCVNPQHEDEGLAGFLGRSLAGAATNAIGFGVLFFAGSRHLVAVRQRRARAIGMRCELVVAHLGGAPQVLGGTFMTQVIGGALGAMWEPLAQRLSTPLPIFTVACRWEHAGRVHGASELCYGDETPLLAPDGTARVAVDRDAPSNAWLVRTTGPLAGAPFASRTGSAASPAPPPVPDRSPASAGHVISGRRR